MSEQIQKNNPIGRLILACFLVFVAIVSGLFLAQAYFFSDNYSDEKEFFQVANPNNLSFYEKLYKFSQQKISFVVAPVAGVIPHHLLAGDLIANFFANLQEYQYDTVILIGPNHFLAGKGKIISSQASWQTPYGVLKIDDEILQKLNSNNVLSFEDGVFLNEHAVFGVVAFIKKTFPNTKFVPIILRPNVTQVEAENLATSIYELSKNKRILVISSTDFSHYKTSDVAIAEDKQSLEILNTNDLDKAYSMAVDSPASTYVLMKYSQLSGADFKLLRNSNSALLSGINASSTTSYITGYFVSGENNLPEVVNTLPTSESRDISFLFFGDLMLDREVKNRIKKNGGLDYIFSKLEKSEIFKGNDIVSANLEGAVIALGEHYLPENKFDFSFATETVSELKKYNFNFFNIANNHLADQGKNGIIETEKNLSDLGFNFSGCQDREIGECTSKIVEVNGKKIGFAGASMVYGNFDQEALIENIKSLASSTDLVVAQIHWGVEYSYATSAKLMALAHKLIDAGADMIVGHHPHVVGGIEIYQNKPIFYSLGNFVFDQDFSIDTKEELGVKIVSQGSGFKITLFPIVSYRSSLSLMEEPERAIFLSKLAARSIGGENFKQEIKTGIINIK